MYLVRPYRHETLQLSVFPSVRFDQLGHNTMTLCCKLHLVRLIPCICQYKETTTDQTLLFAAIINSEHFLANFLHLSMLLYSDYGSFFVHSVRVSHPLVLLVSGQFSMYCQSQCSETSALKIMSGQRRFIVIHGLLRSTAHCSSSLLQCTYMAGLPDKLVREYLISEHNDHQDGTLLSNQEIAITNRLY